MISVNPHLRIYNILRVVFFLRPSMINDAALADMGALGDKSSSLNVLFLCNISVSVGPFSSVILSEQQCRFRSVSDSLVFCI